MGHFIGRFRKRAGRAPRSAARGQSAAVRAALQGGEAQAKLHVGPRNDAYEREADAVAARVVADQPVGPVSTLAGDAGQRKCAGCEDEDEKVQAQRKAELQRQSEEEDEELQMKRRDVLQRQTEDEEEEELQMKRRETVQRQPEEEEDEELQTKRCDSVQRVPEAEEEEELQMKRSARGSGFGQGISARIDGVRGGGLPLASGPRRFFEHRMGADFSDVRIHTGPAAQAAAEALNARAFTIGRDVVFGPGEYAPGTRRGTELMAHELTHVIQQRGRRGTPEGAPIQRWQVGASPAPVAEWETVPDGTPAGQPDHRAGLTAARAVVARLLSSTRCQNYFADHCESGSATSLRDTFDAARVYRMDQDGTLFGESILGTNDIAYNNSAYGQGRYFLAATLLHEMYHACAPNRSAATRELAAENALEACRLYAPYLREIAPRSGPAGSEVTLTGWGLGPHQGPRDRVEFNGATCSVLSWSFNASTSMVTIRVELPAGARTGHFRVFNNNVGSRPAAFTVT